ncbi:MAG: PEGA domain-containing protein [Proteobacteria bacterium]|nr:PEGA domain-containing protein [Pseudomonadota bacterium]MCP4920520.1 PEGA domain-containing protein [Pseudomonadota bacterium]
MVQVKGDCLTDTKSADVTTNGVTRLEMELKPLGGFAQIAVTPADATVILDGEPLKVPAAIELSCGTHTLTSTASGYLSDTRDVKIEMGGAYKVDVAMALEGFGTLSVVVNPVDAKVFLDGTEIATGPTTIPEVPKGSHLVGATANDLAPREETVEVVSGETTRVEFDLTVPSDAVGDPSLVVTVPPEEEKTPREPREINATKLIAGGALVAVGVGAIGAGGAIRAKGLEFHEQYAALDGDGDGWIDPENEAVANRLWQDEIQPRKVQSTALFAVGGVALLGGAGAFVLLEEDGAMIGVNGRF